MKIPQYLRPHYRYCYKIATDHYENFPVASVVVPKHLRPHIAAIYAFARIADDFADESQNATALQQWRTYLHQFPDVSGIPHPLFPALFYTIQQFSLPIALLDDLLTAFQKDLTNPTFYRWDDLLDYSHYSANPIGRLLLILFGYSQEELLPFSDAICTALQLTNFWQDLSRDLPRGRCYIPLEELQALNLPPELSYFQAHPRPFLQLFRNLLQRTEKLYQQGYPLLHYLKGRFALEIRLVLHGGMQTLQRIHQMRTRILYERPTLTITDWLQFLWRPAYRKIRV